MVKIISTDITALLAALEAKAWQLVIETKKPVACACVLDVVSGEATAFCFVGFDYEMRGKRKIVKLPTLLQCILKHAHKFSELAGIDVRDANGRLTSDFINAFDSLHEDETLCEFLRLIWKSEAQRCFEQLLKQSGLSNANAA